MAGDPRRDARLVLPRFAVMLRPLRLAKIVRCTATPPAAPMNPEGHPIVIEERGDLVATIAELAQQVAELDQAVTAP